MTGGPRLIHLNGPPQPQLVARAAFVEQLAELANDVGARFVELVLMVDKQVSRDRFADRLEPSSPGRFNAGELVARNGGLDSLDIQYDALVTFVEDHDYAVVLEVGELDSEAAYAAVTAALEPP